MGAPRLALSRSIEDYGIDAAWTIGWGRPVVSSVGSYPVSAARSVAITHYPGEIAGAAVVLGDDSRPEMTQPLQPARTQISRLRKVSSVTDSDVGEGLHYRWRNAWSIRHIPANELAFDHRLACDP